LPTPKDIPPEFQEPVNPNKPSMADRLKGSLKHRLNMISDWNDFSFIFEASNLKLLIPEVNFNVNVDKISFVNRPKWEVIPMLEKKASLFQKPVVVDPKALNKGKALPPPPTKKVPPPLPPKSGEKVPPPLPPKEGGAFQAENPAPTVTPTGTDGAPKQPPPLPEKKGNAAVVKQALQDRIKSGTMYRFEADCSGVYVEMATSPLEKETVFETEKLKLFITFNQHDLTEEDGEVHSVNETEWAVQLGAVNLKLNDDQFIQFVNLIKVGRKDIMAIIKKSKKVNSLKDKVKDKVKSKMEEGKEMLNSNQLPDMEGLKDIKERVEGIKDKIEQAVHRNFVTFVFRAEKGTFDIPYRALMKIQNLEALKKKVAKIRPKVPLKFENFEFGIENAHEKQNFMLKLKSMNVQELDIPKAPQFITFEPLPYDPQLVKIFNLSADETYNLRIFYSRYSPKDQDSHSEIWIRLENMNIVFKKKPKDQRSPLPEGTPEKPSTLSTLSTPNIEKIIQKVVSMIDSKKEKIFSGLEAVKQREAMIKENLGKFKMDFRWEFEMGDCHVTYSDEERSEKPVGTFKVSNNSQMKQVVTKFLELEHHLIQSKLDTAQMMSQGQTEKDDLFRRVKDLEDKLSQFKKEKEAFENKYIEAKMSLSEVQMQNQDLQRAVFILEKKARDGK